MSKEPLLITNLRHRLLATLRNARDEYELMDAIRTYNDDFPDYLSAKLETEAAIELLKNADQDHFADSEIAAAILDLLKAYRRYLAESGWGIRKRVVEGLIQEIQQASGLREAASSSNG